MAFSKGFESTEGAQFKRYIGVGAAYVKGVNLTKAESEKFFGRELTEEPVYVGKNDAGTPFVRVSFALEIDKEKHPDVDLKTSLNFFIRREPRANRDNTKKQVIDIYGRTAWATQAEIDAKEIPTYSNGKKANISPKYRVAYNGEEDLIKFLIAYLNIPAPSNYVNGEWKDKSAEELKDCEAFLENVEKYFTGDVSELKQIISYQPLNKVKICFGVRKSNDGKEYQNCYIRMFLKNSSTNYERLAKDIREAKDAGAYSTTEFDTADLHEYVVTPTDFSAPAVHPVDDLPFGPETSEPNW